jgi:hypothetical protein
MEGFADRGEQPGNWLRIKKIFRSLDEFKKSGIEYKASLIVATQKSKRQNAVCCVGLQRWVSLKNYSR